MAEDAQDAAARPGRNVPCRSVGDDGLCGTVLRIGSRPVEKRRVDVTRRRALVNEVRRIGIAVAGLTPVRRDERGAATENVFRAEGVGLLAEAAIGVAVARCGIRAAGKPGERNA